MEEADQQSTTRSRVVKVDSKQSWDLLISEANSQHIPVFVHFTASWCVPSLAMNPYFDELSMAREDVLFLLVDVDELRDVASKLEVKAMPTFVLMKDGAEVDRMIGANPEELEKRLHSFVPSVCPMIEAE